MDNQELLTPDEATAFLRMNPRTLENLRYVGRGPAYTKLANRVFYRRSDLISWIDSRVRQTRDTRGPQAVR
jgi:hypothetical protein